MGEVLNKNPLVSVIVPVYNRENLIERCLESIVNQTYGNIEIIVVDNNSSDNTCDRVTAWIERNNHRVKTELLSESKRGACAARNRGLQEARGEYVIFFDSDDAMRPTLISKAINKFIADDKTEIVAWNCCIHLLDGNERIPPFNIDNPIEGHLIHALLRPQGYMAKTDLIKRAGGWNENLPAWNDWELGTRLLLLNPLVAGIDETLADIYSQADSITGENFSSREGIWEKSIEAIRQKVSTSLHPESENIIRMLIYREVILAAHYSKEGNKRGAKTLKEKATAGVKGKKRMLLDFAFHYTRLGGRGAWRMIKYFY